MNLDHVWVRLADTPGQEFAKLIYCEACGLGSINAPPTCKTAQVFQTVSDYYQASGGKSGYKKRNEVRKSK